jgi:hypothetical protein
VFEHDLRHYSRLAQLAIHEEDDPCTVPLQEENRCNTIAEASDLARLQDLLSRREYEPIGIVRFSQTRQGEVSVFFRLKDTDDDLGGGEDLVSEDNAQVQNDRASIDS